MTWRQVLAWDVEPEETGALWFVSYHRFSGYNRRILGAFLVKAGLLWTTQDVKSHVLSRVPADTHITRLLTWSRYVREAEGVAEEFAEDVGVVNSSPVGTIHLLSEDEG